MTYESPFSNRYGSDEMRGILSDDHKVWWWQQIWLANLVAIRTTLDVEAWPAGYVDSINLHIEVLKDLGEQVVSSPEERSRMENITSHELEASRRLTSSYIRGQILEKGLDPSTIHDVLHLGMTSSDVQDNAEVEIIDEALDLLCTRGQALISNLCQIVDEHRATVCVGMTHLQPAEPTTVGYRFASHLSDIIGCQIALKSAKLLHKGIGGAVGTLSDQFFNTPRHMGGADAFTMAYGEAINSVRLDQSDIMRQNINIGAASGQTAPRMPYLLLANILGTLAMALHRLALNVRYMSMVGEASEGRRVTQVGSSAMPHKVNPIMSESICGLSRIIAGHTSTLWHTYANQGLERTLDDSSVHRVVWPEILLAMDELLRKASRMTNLLRFDEQTISYNLEQNRVAMSQSLILSWLVRNVPGRTREYFHETLGRLFRLHPYSSGAFLAELCKEIPDIERILGSPTIIRQVLLEPESNLGEAVRRCEGIVSYGMDALASLHR